mgnify:CR=1 FL=1
MNALISLQIINRIHLTIKLIVWVKQNIKIIYNYKFKKNKAIIKYFLLLVKTNNKLMIRTKTKLQKNQRNFK